MAITYAGNVYGATAGPIHNMQVEADCYVGQIVIGSAGAGGHVLACAGAGAGPDTTNNIIGIIVGAVTSPTYDSTYQGDKITYDTTQANQLLNDPVGAALAQVQIIRPGDLLRCPLYKTTKGTALDVLSASAVSTDGLAVYHTGTAITALDDDFSTVYCRTGANRGIYRVVTTGGTKTQTLLIGFPYDIAIGDTFVTAQMKLGVTRFEFDSYKLGIAANDDLTQYFMGYCHKLDLEKAGEEYAIVSIHTSHLWG